MHQNILDLKSLLDKKVEQYNNSSFISNDPISIPHLYTKQQDIEIMGFFASIFAWGQRKTIINKCHDLASRMDNAPFQFITQHEESDLKALVGFKHRTFNDSDLLYFISFFRHHFQSHDSLEEAFFPNNGMSIEDGLNYFYNYALSAPDMLTRTRKHISAPSKHSACKRLNMFLRWMVRKDDKGVDFGIWDKIKPKDLICPLDVHVKRTARMLNLLTRDKDDWKAAIELTKNLSMLDANDPVKYDFALFGISIEEKCLLENT